MGRKKLNDFHQMRFYLTYKPIHGKIFCTHPVLLHKFGNYVRVGGYFELP